MSRIPLARQLGTLAGASERRFRLFMLDSQQKTSNAEIARLEELLGAEMDVQKQITEQQVEAMGFLTEAVNLSNETAADAEEFAKTQGVDFQTKLDDLEAKVDGHYDEAVKANAALALRVALLEIMAPTDKSYTGEIKLMHDTIPRLWLECTGNEVRKSDYPELAAKFQDAYGTPSRPDCFKLPGKSDLTDDPVVLNNLRLTFIVRS